MRAADPGCPIDVKRSERPEARLIDFFYSVQKKTRGIQKVYSCDRNNPFY